MTECPENDNDVAEDDGPDEQCEDTGDEDTDDEDTDDEDTGDEGAPPAEGELVHPNGLAGIFRLFRSISKVEQRRVEVQEARNNIALRALEVSENSDRRQFEFHKEKLATDERARDKSHSLARMVLLYGGGAVLVLAVLVMGMAFFGNHEQSAIAMELIGVAGKAIGGAGFIYLVAAAVRRLTKG